MIRSYSSSGRCLRAGLGSAAGEEGVLFVLRPARGVGPREGRRDGSRAPTERPMAASGPPCVLRCPDWQALPRVSTARLGHALRPAPVTRQLRRSRPEWLPRALRDERGRGRTTVELAVDESDRSAAADTPEGVQRLPQRLRLPQPPHQEVAPEQAEQVGGWPRCSVAEGHVTAP